MRNKMKMFCLKIGDKYFSTLIKNNNYNSTGKSGITSSFYGAHYLDEFSMVLQNKEEWFDYRTFDGYMHSIINEIAWAKNIDGFKKIEIFIKEV